MSNVLDHIAADPSSFARQMHDVLELWRRSLQEGEAELQSGAGSNDILSTAASRNGQRIRDTHGKRSADLMKSSEALASAMSLAQQQGSLWADWGKYLLDATERACLTMDTLRKRGDIFLEHDPRPCPSIKYTFKVRLS